MKMKVLYAAAHSGFSLDRVPLGGGAAVCEQLCREWRTLKPFEFDVLGPSLLGTGAPREKDLVRYSEIEYARFCFRFERVLTEEILRHDPGQTVILCNDVSEGPDFAHLSGRGYNMVTLYHVDVVDYFTSIYLRSWVKPELTTAVYRGLSRFHLNKVIPGVLRLVWEKQEASIRHSRSLVVPSQGMVDVMRRSYPGLPADKIHILPWGGWDVPVSADAVEREKAILLREFPVQTDAPALLMLSRISPEKGHDRLLKALAWWERQRDFPEKGLVLRIAGESAFMMGKTYERHLRRLAGKLRRTRVHFVGFASGARKQALWSLSSLYVFPSRQESYGLTLMEALRAGLPVLAVQNHGSAQVFNPELGLMIPSASEKEIPRLLGNGLKALLSEPQRLATAATKAAAYGREWNFRSAAENLANLVRAALPQSRPSFGLSEIFASQ